MLKNEELRDLAKAAVSHPKWEFREDTKIYFKDLSSWNRVSRWDAAFSKTVDPKTLHWLPDFSDPKTLDCLKALVRDLSGDASWDVTPILEGGETLWLADKPSRARQTRHGSEASAAVAKLLSIP